MEKKMRVIQCSEITQAVRNMCIEATHFLTEDMKEALCRAQLIGKKCKGSDFASAIEMICPNRKACNVAQTLKTYNSREKDTDDESIINDMTEMFNQVKEAF